jgi:predicted GH43/DUF377 family glycosyl hydrolase
LHGEQVLVLHANDCNFLQPKRKKYITWRRLWLADSAEKTDVWLVTTKTVETWQRKWEKAGKERKTKETRGMIGFFFPQTFASNFFLLRHGIHTFL